MVIVLAWVGDQLFVFFILSRGGRGTYSKSETRRHARAEVARNRRIRQDVGLAGVHLTDEPRAYYGPSPASCTPRVMVIFGIDGDLAKRKPFPAVNLNGHPAGNFAIVGLDRPEDDDRKKIGSGHGRYLPCPPTEPVWQAVLQRVHYHNWRFFRKKFTYRRLNDLSEVDGTTGMSKGITFSIWRPFRGCSAES